MPSNQVLNELARLDAVRKVLYAQGYTPTVVVSAPARLVQSLANNRAEQDVRDGALAAMASGAEPTSALAAGKEFARLMSLERKKVVDDD